MCRPGLCSAANELSCVTVSSASLGSVVTAIVHPTAAPLPPPPPPVTGKLHSRDDAVQLSASDMVDTERLSHLTDHTNELAVSSLSLLPDCVCL